MTIDLRQFCQVFFDEAQEHLASMEALLLEIDLAMPDAEEVNALFRAAHSIKGGAATFGFQDVADATHVLETMLDRVRQGELTMTREMVDAALAAGDVLGTMLAAHRGGAGADAAAVAAITDRLRGLAAGAAQAEAIAPAGEAMPAAADRGPVCEIAFEAAPHVLADPLVIENLLAELRALGTLDVVQLPGAEGGGQCLLRLGDAPGTQAIEALVDFVAVPGSLRIAPKARPAPDDGFGFFDELPPPDADKAEEAYGFFADLPPAGQDGGAVAAGGDAAAVSVCATAPPGVRAPAAAKGRPAGEGGSIRVGVDKVDQLINLVGELVITQAMLAQSAARLDPVLHERLFDGLSQLERNTRDLQESVMSIRMLPISGVFNRFPRVVRDLSQRLGKQVELVTSGETTELDKGLIERITDPLTHLVRNAIDHGIEAPEARTAAGKPATGTVRLAASQHSGNIVIEVADDGAGLRRERILAKARERGLPVSEAMSDQDVWALIMEPGFSTAEQVTEVSGRGVGMDVVRRNVAALGGRIEIDSVARVGTRITVRLPLTLAILDGMSVAVGEETYIIPLAHVVESLQAAPAMLKAVSGAQRLLQVRGEYLPIVALQETFGLGAPASGLAQGIMVIVESEDVRAALFVDALLGQQQVVIKSLEANYRRVPGVSAATIMGDGRVALILDVPALLSRAQAPPRLAA